VRRWRERGGAVRDCYLVIFACAADCAAVHPVRVQAARLDAEKRRVLSAGPTCPTCPTKIGKREEEDSVCCRSFLMRFVPAPSSRLRFCSRGADSLTWLDLSQRLNGARVARESDRGSRQVDTRGRCSTHRVLKSGDPRRSGRPRPHFSPLRQRLRA
jgi:hypothetical protein